MTKDGLGEGVSGMVIITKGENSKTVIERVQDRVSKIEKSLPAGVKLTPFYHQTTLVNRTIHTVATNLIEGGMLVILFLFLFLYNIRAFSSYKSMMSALTSTIAASIASIRVKVRQLPVR